MREYTQGHIYARTFALCLCSQEGPVNNMQTKLVVYLFIVLIGSECTIILDLMAFSIS